MDEAKANLEKNAVDKTKESSQKVLHCSQKSILLVVKSELGWKTVEEYSPRARVLQTTTAWVLMAFHGRLVDMFFE